MMMPSAITSIRAVAKMKPRAAARGLRPAATAPGVSTISPSATGGLLVRSLFRRESGVRSMFPEHRSEHLRRSVAPWPLQVQELRHQRLDVDVVEGCEGDALAERRPLGDEGGRHLGHVRPIAVGGLFERAPLP